MRERKFPPPVFRCVSMDRGRIFFMLSIWQSKRLRFASFFGYIITLVSFYLRSCAKCIFIRFSYSFFLLKIVYFCSKKFLYSFYAFFIRISLVYACMLSTRGGLFLRSFRSALAPCFSPCQHIYGFPRKGGPERTSALTGLRGGGDPAPLGLRLSGACVLCRNLFSFIV